MYEFAMNGQEIAEELGVTRQAVSNTLKKAMAKVYAEVTALEPKFTPFEVASTILQMFDLPDDDAASFFKLFPPKIRDEIQIDAYRFLRGSVKAELGGPKAKVKKPRAAKKD